ncbi:MAG: RsmD family RNA methyltransferase [Rickettsiales bacterium]|nr:RsmD family RNA methyltransferase [Rickettsiales bacterium]
MAGFAIRIEHGDFKGVKISDGFKGDGSRITTSFNRCVLFNVLTNKLGVNFDDLNCADFCCGSGIVGFEMLSMGAGSCIFVDSDRKKVQNVKNVLQKTRFNGLAECAFLPNLPIFHDKLDVIFFDPPYDNNFCERTLANIVNSGILTDNGLIIVETKKPIAEDLIVNLKLKMACVKELKNRASFLFLRKI